MSGNKQYVQATRHPWPNLLFLIPLLTLYEAGIQCSGSNQGQAVRNGADAWLRWVLDVYGVTPLLAAPLIILSVFVLWSLKRWQDRPERAVPVVFGICFESVLWAFGLWAIGHNFVAITRSLGIPIAALEISFRDDVLTQILTFVGAGIYEEVLFRLFIITGLAALLKCAFVPNWLALLLAAIGSAFLFAAAHHFGPHGEPLDTFRFIYRVVAGLYFATLFWLRGFGVAVGAHALYDVFVGVTPR